MIKEMIKNNEINPLMFKAEKIFLEVKLNRFKCVKSRETSKNEPYTSEEILNIFRKEKCVLVFLTNENGETEGMIKNFD